MKEVVANPLFGLTLSILAYFIAAQIHRKWTNPATTPLLLAVIMVIVFLKATNISYRDYYVGGSYLNTLIIPSTVALGIPLFQAFKLMRFHARSIIAGVVIGAIVNTTLTALLAKAFGMNFFLAISLFPKSVTTAMAIGITSKMGGMTTITLVVVVATGILTSVIGTVLLDLFGISADDVISGLEKLQYSLTQGFIDSLMDLREEYEEYCSSWIIFEEYCEDNHIELSNFDYYGDLPYKDKITELLDHSFEKAEKYLKLKIGIDSRLNSLKEYIKSFDLNLTLNEELSFNSIIQEDYE